MKRSFATCAAALIAISAASAQERAGHSSSESTGHNGPAGAEFVLDNEQVSVVRIRMAPHEKTPIHELTARVVVWLTDAHLRDTLASGEVHDERARAGEVEWVPAQRHQGENLGDESVAFIAVIPKQALRTR
jgi:quercetin dioxygenase-like cupin family protein